MGPLPPHASVPAFTPLPGLAGGLMLASSTIGLLALTGNVLGISGFVHQSVRALIGWGNRRKEDKQTTYQTLSIAATAGLITGGFILQRFRHAIENSLKIQLFDPYDGNETSISIVNAFAGLAVGLGTRLGSGCTSGHMLCGFSRLSPRSVVATATFFSIGAITHIATSSSTVTDIDPYPSNWSNSGLIDSESVIAFLVLQAPFLIYGVLAFLIPWNKIATEARTKAVYYASIASAFSIGIHFAFGLGVTGMLRESKVLGFLNLSPIRISNGSWDPSLAMVAVGGILPGALDWFLRARPLIEKAKMDSSARFQPVFSPICTWNVPSRTDITSRLVIGSAIFGLGWGLTGGCPGPVLVNFGASSNVKNIGISLGAISLGGLLGDLF